MSKFRGGNSEISDNDSVSNETKLNAKTVQGSFINQLVSNKT
jgi:hypothetical protein